MKMAVHDSLAPYSGLFDEYRTYSHFKKINGVYWGYVDAFYLIQGFRSYGSNNLYHSYVEQCTKEEVDQLTKQYKELMVIPYISDYYVIKNPDMIRWILTYPDVDKVFFRYYLQTRRGRKKGIETRNPFLKDVAEALSIQLRKGTLPGLAVSTKDSWKMHSPEMNRKDIYVGVKRAYVGLKNHAYYYFREVYNLTRADETVDFWGRLNAICQARLEQALVMFHLEISETIHLYQMTDQTETFLRERNLRTESHAQIWRLGDSLNLTQELIGEEMSHQLQDIALCYEGEKVGVRRFLQPKAPKKLTAMKHLA